MARVTRAESKKRTRQRLLAEAQRLFREHGYAATSLEQIAEAAGVTKGAIYGHFASKEDLLLSAIEAGRDTTPEYVTLLNERSLPLRDRLEAFGSAVAEDGSTDVAELAMFLEFFAALLRAPDALQRYGGGLERQVQQIAEADRDELLPGTTAVQAWTIGLAMVVGLQIYQQLAPGLVTPEVFRRALGLLATLYQEP